MKPLLATLSFLMTATATASLNNVLNITTLQKNNIINTIEQKTQQDTIYIDKNGNQVTTNKVNLAGIDTKEIIQIGFFQNQKGEIEAVRMPRTIEKVPTQLPPEITSTIAMFDNCQLFNQDISAWNTSNIVDMGGMFTGALSFNQNISSWNTANVTKMHFMFMGTVFNQDISQWDTSKVTNMSYMFSSTLFNQDISKWNVSNVTNMSNMFNLAISFNQDISQWNVSNVTNMSDMFANTLLFNQDISAWNTANVTNMSDMFANAISFNQDISQWNVNKVTQHSNFSLNSGIDNPNKLPKFND